MKRLIFFSMYASLSMTVSHVRKRSNANVACENKKHGAFRVGLK